jgi:hypothetical protein
MVTSRENDMTSASRAPGHEPGTPQGISPRGVQARSELARWISGADVFPTDRAALLTRAEEQSAPDAVLEEVRSPPNRAVIIKLASF